MIVAHDAESGLTQLSRKGGGAAMMKTNTGLIIATFTKDKQCLDPATGQPLKGKF